MTTPRNDWPTVRKLLWDDEEHILIAETERTTKPIRRAAEFSAQPAAQFCCANSFTEGATRKKANLARWHTWIIEFDHMPLAEQRALWEASGLPHTLRVFSGNKSVHVFIRAEQDVSPAEWAEVADALKQTFPDADKQVLSDPARLCRTPNGTRQTGERQTVEYVSERVPVQALRQCLRMGSVSETPETTETTEAIVPPAVTLSAVSATPYSPGEVVRMTLPTGPGQRNKRILDLARGLRFNAGLADKPFPELRPYVEKWHAQAVAAIRTKEFDETWADFVHAWTRARAPLGDVIQAAWENVTAGPLPEEALSYDTEPVRLLVALCKTLGGLSEDGNFFLSSHVAARLLELRPEQVRRKLKMIEADGRIQTRKKGNAHRATRFRWTGSK